MKIKSLFFAAVLMVCVVNQISAQQSSAGHEMEIVLNKYAILGVVGGKSITLTPDENDISFNGATPKVLIDNSKYLHYSVLTSSYSDQKIQARISHGLLREDIQLKLGATVPSDHRNLGKELPEISMSYAYQDIISGINSCSTGTGPSDGAQLTFSLETSNWETAIFSIYGQTITLDFIILDE